MRCTSFITLLTTLAASTIMAGPVFLTSPTQGTVWQTGTEYDIVWNGKDGNSASLNNAPLRIELVWGNVSAVQTLGTLVTACAEKDGRVRIKLQDNLPSGKEYALRAGPQTYTPQFEIVNAEGKNDTTTFPPLIETKPVGKQCGTASGASSVEMSVAGMVMATVAGVYAML